MARSADWRFKDGLMLAALVALAVVAALPAWREIGWTGVNNPEQSHVLLALPMVLWLGWLRRRRVRKNGPRWCLWGTLVAAVGSAMLVVGPAMGFDLMWHAGAVLMAAGAIVSVVGLRFAAAFFPSLVGMVFFLPVPGTIRQRIALPLQEVSAKAAEFALDTMGIAVERAGNALRVNGVDVVIAEACNGMRMVSALALVSFAFIFSVPMSNRIRVLILLISPLVALLVNILRLIPTVLFFGYADQGVASTFHDLSGWLGLVLAAGILWSFLGLLRWLEVPVTPYAVGGTA